MVPGHLLTPYIDASTDIQLSCWLVAPSEQPFPSSYVILYNCALAASSGGRNNPTYSTNIASSSRIAIFPHGTTTAEQF